MKRIKLSQGKITIVDDSLYEKLSSYKWSFMMDRCGKYGYAMRSNKRKTERLHHYVIGRPPKGFVVDHINGDTLDNRKENLRIVPYRINQQNQIRHRNGRLVGATWHNHHKKWQSRIIVNGKAKTLGYFNTELAAHLAYKKAVL